MKLCHCLALASVLTLLHGIESARHGGSARDNKARTVSNLKVSHRLTCRIGRDSTLIAWLLCLPPKNCRMPAAAQGKLPYVRGNTGQGQHWDQVMSA